MFFPIHLLLVQQLLHLFELVQQFLSFGIGRFFRLLIWLWRIIFLSFLFIARTCISWRTAIVAFWLHLFVLLRICDFSVIWSFWVRNLDNICLGLSIFVWSHFLRTFWINVLILLNIFHLHLSTLIILSCFRNLYCLCFFFHFIPFCIDSFRLFFLKCGNRRLFDFLFFLGLWFLVYYRCDWLQLRDSFDGLGCFFSVDLVHVWHRNNFRPLSKRISEKVSNFVVISDSPNKSTTLHFYSISSIALSLDYFSLFYN